MSEPTLEELLGDDYKPKRKTVKACSTCFHQTNIKYCPRVGYFCSTEMEYGGKCARTDGSLALWEPKPPGLLERLLEWLS